MSRGPSASAASSADPDDPGLTAELRPARLWSLAMAAAIAAGLATWLIGERTVSFFTPPARLVTVMSVTMNRPSFRSQVAAEIKNATLTFAVFGAGLSLAMGLVGGLLRGGRRAAWPAALTGLIMGGTAGGGASFAVLPFYYRQLDVASEALSHDLLLPLLIHAGIWSTVGASAGLAFGLGIKSRDRLASVVFGGLLGGLLGAVLYEVIGALAFPTGRTTEPLAGDWAPRLIGRLFVSILSSAFFVSAALSTPRRDDRSSNAGEVLASGDDPSECTAAAIPTGLSAGS